METAFETDLLVSATPERVYAIAADHDGYNSMGIADLIRSTVLEKSDDGLSVVTEVVWRWLGAPVTYRTYAVHEPERLRITFTGKPPMMKSYDAEWTFTSEQGGTVFRQRYGYEIGTGPVLDAVFGGLARQRLREGFRMLTAAIGRRAEESEPGRT